MFSHLKNTPNVGSWKETGSFSWLELVVWVLLKLLDAKKPDICSFLAVIRLKKKKKIQRIERNNLFFDYREVFSMNAIGNCPFLTIPTSALKKLRCKSREIILVKARWRNSIRSTRMGRRKLFRPALLFFNQCQIKSPGVLQILSLLHRPVLGCNTNDCVRAIPGRIFGKK